MHGKVHHWPSIAKRAAEYFVALHTCTAKGLGSGVLASLVQVHPRGAESLSALKRLVNKIDAVAQPAYGPRHTSQHLSSTLRSFASECMLSAGTCPDYKAAVQCNGLKIHLEAPALFDTAC